MKGRKSIMHISAGTFVRTCFLVVMTITSVSSLTSSSTTSQDTKKTIASTIAVCTGPDCRIDGASGSLKQIQKRVGSSLSPEARKNSKIKVTGRPCLGPCGGGPCVVVLDANGKRVVKDQPAETTGPGSLAPADIFGVNATGVYQVRTQQNVDFVVNVALETAVGSDIIKEMNEEATTPTPFTASNNDKELLAVTSSVRPWWDRPRNERKVLQRLAQCLVVYGLYHSNGNGEIGDLQWQTAGVLVFASFFITYGKAV
jgi:hypothetical protein